MVCSIDCKPGSYRPHIDNMHINRPSRMRRRGIGRAKEPDAVGGVNTYGEQGRMRRSGLRGRGRGCVWRRRKRCVERTLLLSTNWQFLDGDSDWESDEGSVCFEARRGLALILLWDRISPGGEVVLVSASLSNADWTVEWLGIQLSVV